MEDAFDGLQCRVQRGQAPSQIRHALPEPLQPATFRAVLTGLLAAVLLGPALVGRRGPPAVARLLPVAGFPSVLAFGDELGVAGLVAAFVGVQVRGVPLAARLAVGCPAGRRAGGGGEGIAGRGVVVGGGPQGAPGGPVVTDGYLERLAGLALAGRARGRGGALLARGAARAPHSALRTAASASRSWSRVWSHFVPICASSRWRSGPEIRAVAAFGAGSVLPGVVSGTGFHSFSFVSGAKTFSRFRQRVWRRANWTRSALAQPDDAIRGPQCSLIERRPPEPLPPSQESQKIPYSLRESKVRRGPKTSESGWQNPKRLPVRLAEIWCPPGDGSPSMVPPATSAFTCGRTAGHRWCPKYYRGLMPKPLARAARRDVTTSRPRPRTIGCASLAALADVPMTDRRWCANPNAVLEVDPCTRAVGLSRSDVVPGALEGVHIDWRDPRAVTVALKSRKSDVGKLWDDILTWPPAVKLGGSPLLDGVRLPPPRVEAVEPGLSSPRRVETALGPAASGRDLADILPPPGSQSARRCSHSEQPSICASSMAAWPAGRFPRSRS